MIRRQGAGLPYPIRMPGGDEAKRIQLWKTNYLFPRLRCWLSRSPHTLRRSHPLRPAPSPRKPTSTAIPMVDSYRIEYAYFVDKKNPEYKGPWNEIHNTPRVLHPGGQGDPDAQLRHAVFLALALDLRAEPMVLTVPVIEKESLFQRPVHRCLYLQLRLPWQPHHGQRRRQLPHRRAGLEGREAQGDQEGDPAPRPTLTLAVYRTQLFNPGDIDNVKKVQAGYKVAAALGVPRHSRSATPRRPLISSSRSRTTRRRPRSSSSTS